MSHLSAPSSLFKPFKSPLLAKKTSSSDESDAKKPAASAKTAVAAAAKPAAAAASTASAASSSTTKKFVSPMIKKTDGSSSSSQGSTKATGTGASKTAAASSSGAGASADTMQEWQYWNCMHTKDLNKKRKKYEDGILVIQPKKYQLLDLAGKKVIEKTDFKTIQDLKDGGIIFLGNREIEVMSRIKPEDYASGKCFLQNSTATSQADKYSASAVKAPKMPKFKAHTSAKVEGTDTAGKEPDPAPAGTIVINDGHPAKDTEGRWLHDVFIDSFMAKSMRPHQVEGVKFMYECVMGLRNYMGKGCLLADEMGLGKTLQSIALIWTLLQRGPYGSPVLKKVVIVTNSSLVHNWRKEFKKWLGDTRLTPLVVGTKTAKESPSDVIKAFKSGHHKVLIISYNLCINYADDLEECKVDMLICDEGHKLKNSGIKIVQSLKRIATPRRIILSGTPLQNDLSEFFAIVDFVNPGLLGDPQTFKNLFTDPINRSREPAAKEIDKKVGLERSRELNNRVNSFVLRRTNALLTAHLPPKTEMVVFCRMTEMQRKLYRSFVKSKAVTKLTSGSGGDLQRNALSCIQSLKKLLTHPSMVFDMIQGLGDEDGAADAAEVAAWKEAAKLFPTGFEEQHERGEIDVRYSGKMLLLARLLREVKAKGDRIVVVSNFTSILNEIEKLLKSEGHAFCRLDGSTASDKRMEIVDRFNNGVGSDKSDFVFLLSSKAGGAGLNLIGANRLALFDPDWNPSTDEQAMARVWRDGQKKPVFIYRFVSMGTIEEKMFQRQMVKKGLSKTVVDEQASKAQFSKEMLKEIFKLPPDDPAIRCETFEEEVQADVLTSEDDKLRSKDPALSSALLTEEEANASSEEADDAHLTAIHGELVSFVKIVMENAEDAKLRLTLTEGVEDGDDEDDEDAGSPGAEDDNEEEAEAPAAEEEEEEVKPRTRGRKRKSAEKDEEEEAEPEAADADAQDEEEEYKFEDEKLDEDGDTTMAEAGEGEVAAEEEEEKPAKKTRASKKRRVAADSDDEEE